MKNLTKFLTLSRVLNDCRDSVGRLSTLFLLLFALSFGFNQQAKANADHVVGVAANNSNNYTMKINVARTGDPGEYQQKDMSKAGITFEGKKLYVTSYEEWYGGVGSMQFQLYSGSTWKEQKQPISGWTTDIHSNEILEYDNGNNGTWYSKLTMGKSKVYFNATGWSQTTLKLVVGHANYQAYYQMSKITNTQLYYGNPDLNWSDAMGFGVVGGTSASDGTNWLTNVSASAKEYTGFLHYGLNNNDDNVMYYVTNAGTTGQKPSCDYHANYTDLNKTQTVKVMVKAAGGSYSEKAYGSWPATIKAKRYKLNSNGASGADETDADLTSATFTSVITSAAKIYVPTPNTGYTFKGWGTSSSDTPSDASTAYEYTVEDEKTIYLFFDENTYSVTAAKGTGCASVYPTGAQTVGQITGKEFTATGETGYHFVNWTSSNGGSFTAQTSETTTFKPTGDATITANFEEILTTVNVSAGDHGSVSPSGNQSVGVTTNVSVTATPDDGYHFDSWAVTGNAVINGNTLRGNGNGGTGTLKATFAETLYTITINSGTAASTTAGCVTTGTATAATAPTGKKFDKWELGEGITLVDCAVSDETIIFHASQEATVTATYTDASKYSLNVVAGTGITAVFGGLENQTSFPFSSDISATVKTGYTFSTWTATGAGASNVTFSPNATTASTKATVTGGGSVTLTASATPNTNTAYTVKHYKQNLAGTGYDLADTDNLTGTTDAQVTPDVKNYEGFTAPSTQTITIAGNGTTIVEYQYTRKSYNISYTTQATGWTYGEIPATAKFGAEVSFVVNPTSGYTVSVTSSDVQLSQDGNTYTFTMPAKDVAISVSATEIKSALSTAVNAMGSTAGQANPTIANSVSAIGVTTTATITAEAAKAGYTFEGWTLTNCARTNGGAEKATTITVKGLGNAEAAIVTANYAEDLSTPWRLNIGVDKQDNTWQQPNFVKRTGESTGKIAYVSVELTGGTVYHFNYVTGTDTYKGPTSDGAEMPANAEWTFDGSQRAKFIAGVSGTYTFKIDYSDNDKPKASYETPSTSGIKGDWTSWAHEDGTVVDNVLTYTHTFDATGEQKFKVVFNGVFYGQENEGGRMTRQNHENWTLTSTNGGKDIYLNVDMTGEYIFTYNGTTNKLSVTYPSETMTSVTVYLDGETASTVEVGEATHPTIEAVQYVKGKRFDKWVADAGVTLANANDRSTQITAVTSAGLSVRATYTTENMVYFKNTPGWGDVHVFFYTVVEHWKDNGTGVKYKKDDGTWVQIATGHHMTRLNDKSDIWYYDYSGISSVQKAIAFNDHDQYDYEYFANCQAAYRTDWDRGHNLSVFVPEKNISEKKNNNTAAYYNKGYWMKYDDLQTGYYLRISKDDANHEFVASSAGEPYKTTITLEGTQTYNFNINGCNGSYYRNNGEMTSSGSHSGWDFYEGVNNNCRITTSAAGNYTFTLTFGDGILYVSVEYPLSTNDYRVVYTDNSHPCHPSTFIRKGEGNKDTVSFFIDKEKNPALKFQYCSNISGSTVTWTDVDGGTISLEGITEIGIYNFYLEQTESSISCTGNALYEGDFYIRTAIAAGGWDAYKGSDDNLLPYIEYGLDESQPFKFTHAYTNWVEKDKNVKFCIANDYSLCISDTLIGDKIIGTGDNADWLKNGANIRFMWNKNTNELKRAYISGSTNDEERFLMLENTNDKMYNKEGNEQIDELKFIDKNNWVYQADIKAQPGCEVKLTAQYTIGSEKHVQYFMGSESTTRTIISGSATDKQYTMRVVYDFKTNRLTAGWVPTYTIENPLTDQISLGGDLLLERIEQGDASQIIFGRAAEKEEFGKISEVEHVYGVLKIMKSSMVNNDGTPAATNANYAKTMYWISFPFNVKISEIFGVDGYGQKWIMQKYRGDLRAQKGWFKGDGTETFWEFMDESETLNAYEGYLFLIDANYFNTDGADVWKNSATEANFYFPSASGNIGIINQSSFTQPVSAHKCSIDREFSIGKDTEGNDIIVNHKNTDSYWNVIGVPAFQNHTAGATPANDNFKSYYAWVPETNSYNAAVVMEGVTFKTMHAYMVQFGGTLTWSNVSVVSKAPYAYADEKNYLIDLFFSNSEAEDHTYINLADEANTDFVLNEDMMKIDNAGFPNIYSFAGNYNVAYNETKMDNQSVMLGVSAPKDGNYTFAMPKDFSGTAKLVDLVEGITTDLNVANYSVDLNKGTYNNRFQLVLEVEAKTPTSMENVDCGWWMVDGKTTKLLRNGNIYLINGGRVYNVLGVEE